MSALSHAARGIREAIRRPGLVLGLWMVNLAFAATVALPVWLALDRLLARAPAGDVLLDRASFALAADVRRAAPDLSLAIRMLFAAAALVALVLAPYVAAGTVEVLRTAEGRSAPFRFARGAWLLGGRFLRAGLAALPTAAAAAALGALPWFLVRQRLEESTAGSARFGLAVIGLACAGLAVVETLLALDLARLDIARRDSRRPIRLYFGALRLVLLHPLRVFGPWLLLQLPVAAGLALYGALRANLAVKTWTAIALMVAVQQSIALARAGSRLALWSAEGGLLDELAPLPVALAEPPAHPIFRSSVSLDTDVEDAAPPSPS